MEFEEMFAAIHESRECLLGLQGYFFDDTLVAIRFQFGNEVVVLTAEEDDDTVGVYDSSWISEEKGLVLRELSDLPPWNEGILKPLMWSWRMTNQQGYFDGVQFQFGRDSSDLGVKIQILVEGSEFKVSKLY